MSKKKADTPAPETPKEEAQPTTVETTGADTSSRTPLMLAIVAIALAVFAAATSMFGGRNFGLYEKINSIEARLANVESLIADDKRNLVQGELKKILLSVQELSRLSDEETRAQISEVEKILNRMTTDTTETQISVPVFKKSVTIEKIIGEKMKTEPPTEPEVVVKERESVPIKTAPEPAAVTPEPETPTEVVTEAADKEVAAPDVVSETGESAGPEDDSKEPAAEPQAPEIKEEQAAEPVSPLAPEEM